MSERVFLTYDEAVAMLPDGETIHTFTNPAVGMMVGADWSREDILELFKTGKPELSGEQATAIGHGIVAYRMIEGGKLYDPIFIATKDNEAKDSNDGARTE